MSWKNAFGIVWSRGSKFRESQCAYKPNKIAKISLFLQKFGPDSLHDTIKRVAELRSHSLVAPTKKKQYLIIAKD